MIIIKEETLDPENWDELKQLGYKMVEESIEYLKSIRERKVWQPIPIEVKKLFKEPLPQDPTNLPDIYETFKELIFNYPMGNIHPRFWGWVIGTGTFSGALADMLASVVNSNLGGGDHGPAHLENQVIEWIKEMFNFPKESSGLLVTGGSMANLIGLTVARNTMLKKFIRKTGLQESKKQFTFYGSDQMHNSLQKSIELLGFGSEYLRHIPTDGNFKIDIEILKEKISDDKAIGVVPICLIGNAGTVNTGAFDDLVALRNIANDENMWLHVDGAFGSLTHITKNYNHLCIGIESADSLSFDFHKWLYVNYEAGCILVKKKVDHLNTFALESSYLKKHKGGIGGSSAPWFSDYGVELSRNFKALKIWMSFKEHGINKYGRLISQNIEQAQYLGDLISKEEKLELMAPIESNIVCFRYVPFPCNLTTQELNVLNENILVELQSKGLAAPSYTNITGNYVIRMANTNHRSRREDFDFLVAKTLEIGDELNKLVKSSSMT